MNTKTVSDVASELAMPLEEVIGHMERVGVRGTTASTQLNNDELQNLMNLVRPWDKILSHVLSPDANAAPFIIEKRDGAIVLSKEWDPQYKAAVWTKTYQPKSAETTGDLSFLCEWENDLLRRAHTVSGCVGLVDSTYKASPLHLPDTPEDNRQHRSSCLRTFDAGPTLDVWQLMRPRVYEHPQAHPFVGQRNYLQLALGILRALKVFHSKGFIHCDLASRNIALPVRETRVQTDPARGQHILVEPVWDQIRVIDLDFSACRAVAPPIPLPHKLTESGNAISPMSDHLRLRILAINDWLKQQKMQVPCYDREFWARSPQSQKLHCFQTLDWREDLYQLGQLLFDIRDSWGGARHVDDTGGPAEVNTFIDSFAEELMEWGSDNQIDWDPVNLTSKVKAPTEPPHDSYIGRIRSLLDQLGDEPKVMVLRRVDHDLQYHSMRDKECLNSEGMLRGSPSMTNAIRKIATKFQSKSHLNILAGGTALIFIILAMLINIDIVKKWYFDTTEGTFHRGFPVSGTVLTLPMRATPDVRTQGEEVVRSIAVTQKNLNTTHGAKTVSNVDKSQTASVERYARPGLTDIPAWSNPDVPAYPRYHLYGFSYDDEAFLASILNQFGVQAVDMFLEKSAEAGGLNVSINLVAENGDQVKDHFDVPSENTATAISRWLSDHLISRRNK